jgi:hypothetical protein
MKLSEGAVMLFPAIDSVLLPRSGGSLGTGKYWFISQASYVDADTDALRIRVFRRALDAAALMQGPWPEVAARPVLAGTKLTLSATDAELRRIVVRNRSEVPLLDAVIIGEEAQILDLPAEVARDAGSVVLTSIDADFDPLAFALNDVMAARLAEVERATEL